MAAQLLVSAIRFLKLKHRNLQKMKTVFCEVEKFPSFIFERQFVSRKRPEKLRLILSFSTRIYRDGSLDEALVYSFIYTLIQRGVARIFQGGEGHRVSK